MTRRTRYAVIVLAGSFALVFAALVLVRPLLQGAGERLTVGLDAARADGRHFRVYTVGGEEEARAYARLLDEYVERVAPLLRETFGIEPTDDRITVLLFADQADFQDEYEIRHGESLEHSIGYYEAQRLMVGAVRLDPGGEPGGSGDLNAPTLRHEAVHVLMDRGLPATVQLPRWLDEGTASALERLHPGTDGRLRGDILEDAQLYTLLHRASDAVGVGDMLTAPRAAWMGEGNHHYYRAATVLVHLLLWGDPAEHPADAQSLPAVADGRAALRTLVEACTDGTPTAEDVVGMLAGPGDPHDRLRELEAACLRHAVARTSEAGR